LSRIVDRANCRYKEPREKSRELFVWVRVLSFSFLLDQQMSSSSSLVTSSFSKRALVHLKKLKPYDGWSVEKHGTTKQVRLLRRSVPLTENYFHDIHYDPVSGNVVGIMTKSPPCQAQVLVNDNGKPVKSRTPTIIYVTTWKKPTSSTTSSTSRSAFNASVGATDADSLSDEQNRQLMQYAAYAVGVAIVAKVVLSAMVSLYLILFPLIVLYAIQTCPSESSFDAKKELKRVMRGHHLPESHPDKPRGWLNQTIAKVSASVTTELATGLGYELSMTNVLNACMIATVNVPSVNRGYIWIGIFDKWRFIYSSELERDVTVM